MAGRPFNKSSFVESALAAIHQFAPTAAARRRNNVSGA
jgi:hypothetical protein